MKISKHLKSLVFLFFLAIGAGTGGECLGTPNISGVSGNLTHGSSVTISGLGFGTKNQAPPLKWDNFESGTDGSEISGWIFTDDTHPAYTAGQYHSGTKSMYCDFTNGIYNRGIRFDTDLAKVYIHLWHRYGGQKSENMKIWDANGWDPCVYTFMGETYQYDTRSGWETNYQYITNGHDQYGTNQSLMNTWREYEAYFTVGTLNGNNGIIWAAHDGNVLVNTVSASNYQSGDECGTYRELRFGKYYGHTTDQQGYAWYDDIYIDNTPQRVMLCGGSSWSSRNHCEIQIPSAWSANSATITVNQGTFSSGSTAYLYAVDLNNIANANGYSVTIGALGGGDTTAPGSPLNLIVR